MAMLLENKRVAVLATDGFEQSELTDPVNALKEAGAAPEVVSPKGGEIRGWDRTDWGTSVPVDVELDSADPERYEALLLPGGVFNPDQLRMDRKAVDFVRHFVERDKPIAAICHGPWTLIEADGVRGKKMTSYPSIRTDLVNAGAQWEDGEAVVDGTLLTSRSPGDLPTFNEKMKEIFSRAPARA